MAAHPSPRSARLLAVTLLVLPALAVDGAYPLTTDSNCGCYRTNATTANYFGSHHFFDFRTLTQYARKPEPLSTFEANAAAAPSSDYFGSPSWTSIWDIQTWNNTQQMKANNSDVTGSDATVSMVNSPNNIFIERNSDLGMSNQTYMTMRTMRHTSFQSASEIESSSLGYQFLSIRMYARTQGASGAVTAMFTYRPGPNQNLQLVQEADLEIRTRDPPVYVQYTNQPSWNATSDIPQATRNVSMPAGRRWSDWAHYRMDWTPGSSAWYVNGILSGSIQFQAPRDPAQVMFNSWSDGGSWSGNMSVNDEASLQIQWIEMVYNNTDPGATRTGKCVNVCSIDETSKIGQPVLLGGNGTMISRPPSLLLFLSLVASLVLSLC